MKLPIIRASQFIQALKREGFVVIRQKGSHVFLRHPDGRTTLVPNHPADTLAPKLLNKMLKKDVKMSRKRLKELL